MSRIRSIKPDYWSSEQVMSLSRDARLLFIGMWNFADDEGRMKFSPMAIKAQVLPGDDVSRTQVEGWLFEIVRVGLMELYVSAPENSGNIYAAVTGWSHQKISHPTPSKYPNPRSNQCSSWSPPENSGALTDSSALIRIDPKDRERESAERADATKVADSLSLVPPLSKTRVAKQPTPAATAKTELGKAVNRLAPEYGHQAPPTASKAHWALGAQKVTGLAASSGATIADAADRVARAALQRLKSGRSSSFGYSLQDCVLGDAASRTGAATPLQTAPGFEPTVYNPDGSVKWKVGGVL